MDRIGSGGKKVKTVDGDKKHRLQPVSMTGSVAVAGNVCPAFLEFPEYWQLSIVRGNVWLADCLQHRLGKHGHGDAQITGEKVIGDAIRARMR